MKGLKRIPLQVGPPVPTVRAVLRAFVEGLQYNTAFPVTVEDGLHAVAIAEACYRSATAGGQAMSVGL